MASKRSIDTLRESISTDYFTDAVVFSIFGQSQAIYSRMSRILKGADVLRLKRGFYVFSEKWRKNPLTTFEIANALYGPSYVSLESALSFYGLIPEAVVETTSVNISKAKLYRTPVGNFRYRIISSGAFPCGVVQKTTEHSKFLMASLEKSLLDKFYLDASINDLYDYAIQSLRIEEADLDQINLNEIISLAQYYNDKKFVKKVQRFIAKIKGDVK